jgi:hypothetical protein
MSTFSGCEMLTVMTSSPTAIRSTQTNTPEPPKMPARRRGAPVKSSATPPDDTSGYRTRPFFCRHAAGSVARRA